MAASAPEQARLQGPGAWCFTVSGGALISLTVDLGATRLVSGEAEDEVQHVAILNRLIFCHQIIPQSLLLRSFHNQCFNFFSATFFSTLVLYFA